MFKQTRDEGPRAVRQARARSSTPKTRADIPTYVLIPAFIICELKTAFQIGFLIFLPFLIIDLVVSLDADVMGMMMLPPVFISLPFKILLFVLVDGWDLVTQSLVQSFHCMNQDVVINLAMHAMTLAHQGRDAAPARRASSSACWSSVFQAVTQIQEHDAHVHPEDPRAIAVVLVIAGPWMLEPDRRLHRAALAAAIPAGRGGNERRCSQQIGEQQLAGFILVLARVEPAVPARAALLVEDAARCARAASPPWRSRSGSRRSALHGQHVPARRGHARRPGARRSCSSASPSRSRSARCSPPSSVAGSLLDTLIGFSFGSLIDPITGNQSHVLSQLYALVGVLIFIAIGGDHWMIEGLARSYDLIPLAELPVARTRCVRRRRPRLRLDLRLGARARRARAARRADHRRRLGHRRPRVPQLNVFAVGFPAKIAVGLLVMGVSLPFVGGWIADQVQVSVSSALKPPRGLSAWPASAQRSRLPSAVTRRARRGRSRKLERHQRRGGAARRAVARSARSGPS